MTLKSELVALAKTIRTRAGDSKTPFAEAIEALKVLVGLYSTLIKDKGKSEDESDGFTMAEAQTMIEESGHGSAAAVRGHRQRSTHDA